MDELSTTTVSNPSKLAKFFLCCCSSSVPYTKFYLHSREFESIDTPAPLHICRECLAKASTMRMIRNTRMLKNVTDLCRTPHIDPEFVQKCIPSAYYDVTTMTCGGMSRIYTAHLIGSFDTVVIKVTDCSKGLGMYEYASYKLLQRHGFSVPRIDYVASYNAILLMIMKKYTFSLATLLIALGAYKMPGRETIVSDIITHIRYILQQFRAKGLTYCDFSPDNVMVDIDTRTMQGRLVLIDPQFLVSSKTLSTKLGKRWALNVDRVHFVHKLRLLAIQEPGLIDISDRVSKDLLGYVPSEKEAKDWILYTLPDGLRIAYDCIANEHVKKNY